jgi:hypothetical protein
MSDFPEMYPIDVSKLIPVGQFCFSRIVLMDENGVNNVISMRINDTEYVLTRENLEVFANAALEELDE